MDTKSNILSTILYCHFENHNRWLMQPVLQNIYIADSGVIQIKRAWLRVYDDPYYDDLETRARILGEGSVDDVYATIAFLKLINCKNISTEVIKAPEALNKKRRKNNKQEIFDYHVLNVVIPGKKGEYREQSEPLSHVRVHLCRGHFKEYTAEHPLFGKLTGLYWWQPHIRGQNKDGIVMKEYNVTTKENKA